MANNKIDKSNLGYLNIDFQYKLVKIFIEEPKFFEGLASIVDQNAFTDSLLRTFVGTIKDYYSANSVTPTYEIMSILLRQKSRSETDIEEWEALIKKLKHETTYEGYSIVKDIALKFFKQQKLIKAANKILEIAGNGDLDRYEECQKMLDEAVMVGEEEDFGFNIYDTMEKALSSDYTISIPTGISVLDDVLGGGIDKGKLGLIIAPAGFGKTSLTTAIDAYAAACKCEANNFEGFKVLQIYFEDDDVDLTRKHYSRIVHREARFMKNLSIQEKDEIETCLNNFQDKDAIVKNLRLKRFKTGTKTAGDLEIFIRKMINRGFKPDLITIDYFECLLPEKGGYNSDNEWTREGVTMRKLETMAQEFNCAIWIPTQGTKDSMNTSEVITMNQASGSAKKVHVAQIILSITRSVNDIGNKRATIAVLKNRSGKSGKIFDNVIFDNGTSTISCEEVQEYNDVMTFDLDTKQKQAEQKKTLIEEVNAKKKETEKNLIPTSKTQESNFVGVINSEEVF